MYPEITDVMLADGAKDEEHLQMLRQVGFTSVMIVPLVAHGRAVGALTFVTAESKRHYEAEDLTLAEDLAGRAALAISNARLYRDSQESSRLKDEFLATMSHELRTPLTAILGMGEFAFAGSLDEESVAQALATIERNARSQVRLIEDLMDVSRIVTGKLRSMFVPSHWRRSLKPPLTPCARLLKPKTSAFRCCSIRRLARFRRPRPFAASAVELAFQRLKFTPKDGRIQVRLERVNSHVEITVTDNGQGISADFLPHVFDRFRQADSTNTRNVGGLGLGLAIVRQLVELHGGTFTSSAMAKGKARRSPFHSPLRRCIKGEATSTRKEERVHPAAGGRVSLDCPPQLSGLKVLVVDDETDARELVVAVLQQCDATVNGSCIRR
jgi:signal transduction histidine kinase